MRKYPDKILSPHSSHTSHSSHCLTILIALIAASCATTAPKTTYYPKAATQATSPNGKYTLENAVRESGGTLTIKNVQSGDALDSLDYVRRATTLWSPSGEKLLINDFEGKNAAHCYLLLLDGGKRLDLTEEFTQSGERSLIQKYRATIEGVRWENDDTIRIKVSGFGGGFPGGFTKYYVYEIGKGFLEKLSLGWGLNLDFNVGL